MIQITPGRIRALGVIAAAMPFAALLGVRMLDPFGGPAIAGAAPATESSELDTTPERQPSTPNDAERAAVAVARAIADEPMPPTPFYYAPGTLHDEIVIDAPAPAEAPPAHTPPFLVSAILSGGGTPIAVINGAALRVGQEIVDGWTLIEVHEAAREVVVEHADGQRLRVPIRR
jgi:hypothetical protein